MRYSQINFRVEQDLKEKSFAILKEQGVTPSKFLISVLEYVASTGKLPVQNVLLSEDDIELLNSARNTNKLTD